MAETIHPFKQAIGSVFGRAAPTYGLLGPPFNEMGRRLVELANLLPGSMVLDVAAGRGAVTFAAAERVGPSGHVLGIDLAAPMVSETSAEISRRGLKHAEIREMDAEQLDLPASSFDAVLCGFGLMFLPNLGGALSEFRRVLRNSGTFAASTWGEGDSRWAWYDPLVRAHLPQTNTPARAPQRSDKVPELLQALENAGFRDVNVVAEPREVIFADEEEWWESLWSHGMRGALDRMSTEALSDLKAEAFAKVQDQREPDGFHQTWQALIATGRQP